jgi:formylglycine-generating enzyme
MKLHPRLSSAVHQPTVLLCVLALCVELRPVYAQVVYEMVGISDSDNAADSATGFGAVGYEYRIGKYEVTIGQYADFLNAVDADGANTHGLYHASMGTNGEVAGIGFSSGAAAGQKYSVIGTPARPITYVSWFDAARFANWMHNGQGNGSTESGAYSLLGGQTSGTAPNRNLGARFFLPTENEWYKAALYSPLLNAGAGGYYTYATQADTAPGNVVGSSANQANYYAGKYAVTQSTAYSAGQTYLTDVGAFAGSASHYGTFDQNGNVWEWNDLAGEVGLARGLRGGVWNALADSMRSSVRFAATASLGNDYYGFRLAGPMVVPEPSTYAMLLAGLACGGYLIRHRKRA